MREELAGAPYFLVEAVPPPGGFLLAGTEGHHAATVVRLRVGERLVLTDGRGGFAPAVVTGAGRHQLEVEVAPGGLDPPPAVRVILVQALPKGERSDLAVDLATEAGVDEIVPWSASRCVARWDGEKATRGVRRWQTVAAGAAKQSRRTRIPPIRPLASSSQVAEIIGRATAAVVLHESGPISITALQWPTAGDVVLVVGPEGGVAPQEIEGFVTAGATVARLGPEVLRTSTAGAVAMGALAVLTGRWG